MQGRNVCEKIRTGVDVDETLSFVEWRTAGPGAAEPWRIGYRLEVVVVHDGTSADSGHYQVYRREGPGEAQWWFVDDAKVKQVATDVLRSDAVRKKVPSALLF